MSKQQVQVAQAETITANEPPKWGELPPPERIAELEARLAEWEQLPVDVRGDPAKGEGRSAFDSDGPHSWEGRLSGADIFYLAARTLAGSAEQEALEAVTTRLRTRALFGVLDFSALHLDGADLSSAHLDGANLGLAHLEGAELGFAHLEGADLRGAYLEGADLRDAHLEGAELRAAHLERTYLTDAHLDGANLGDAHLNGANLTDAHLDGADLVLAHLNGAVLRDAHLEGADLPRAHLEGADLRGAHLEGADVWLASFSVETALDGITLTDTAHGSARLADVRWGGVNLSVVDWEPLRVLGDETQARRRREPGGQKKSRGTRLFEYKTAVRANRQLAVALQTQGLSEDAARFAYRAQVLQCRVYRLQGPRKLGQYVFSLLLATLAGYGYRPSRTLFWYLAVIAAFAFMYMQATTGWIPFGLPAPSALAPLPWYEALILSVSSFHGRGFFQPLQSLGDPVAALAAIEAVIGLFIEISFIATFTQRYFGAR
jgi:uncharacterized protein YjbI with pentapeptide repeats